MQGTKIVATENPRGYYEAVTVVGTPKPGTVMAMLSTAPVQGVYSWEPYGTTAASGGNGVAADGNRKVIAVLVEKFWEGKTYNDAYVTGDMGRVYFPLPGDKLNMLLENQGGTGDSFAIGDELMVDDGTGKLLACDSDAEAQPFTVLETVAALTADAHAFVRFNGSGG